jgi:2,3-bisphosphoglycerate-independent phosphoglycerate mutase
MQKQKVLLLILDGWGHNPGDKSNAIEAANTLCFDNLIKTCPNTLLNASGVYVGLPQGIMGNSEVGHENIGSGRINKQKLTMISDMVRTGEFFKNRILTQAFDHAVKNNSRVHFMGLISEGDVHAHLGHLDGLIEFAKRKSLKEEDVYLHAITDGRDDPPCVAEHLMKRYETKINIATVCGRYWAMDRDKNWDRVNKYLDCVLGGQGLVSGSASQAVLDAYKLAAAGGNPTGASDEFILPIIINKDGLIKENDSIIFFNFRPDRAKQISQRLGNETDFKNLSYVCFADYANDPKLPVAFNDASLPKQEFKNCLGEYLSEKNLKQFRIAETEKFNHVTSFFNSTRKEPFPGEDRLLIPSPKVATYDLQPEMSLPEVRKNLLEAMDKDYELIVCNFANPDMVGHTGVWDAVITALEEVDRSVEAVLQKAKATGHVVMITADHGNADQMQNTDGGIRTAHSTNMVPFVIANSRSEIKLKEPVSNPESIYSSTCLANIAPTILEYLGLEKPKEMRAESLLVKSMIKA